MYLTIYQFIYQIICYSDKGDATTAELPFVGFWTRSWIFLLIYSMNIAIKL